MVGKRSGKALLREEGLERTDNNLDLTTWPMVNMINQKNYYTEYLRREEQILSLRVLLEERRNREKNPNGEPGNEGGDADATLDIDEEANVEDMGATGDQAMSGNKVVVIHPGSQNLRIGLASDALPKTVPMVIARKWKENESEEDPEPLPKRVRLDDGSYADPPKIFGDDFRLEYKDMCKELRERMKANKRRLMPNSKDLVTSFHTKVRPEIIKEHNDPLRIDWTEVPRNPAEAPEYFTGHDALRIPEQSKPRYKLFWPLQHGWYNEAEYDNKTFLLEDISTILEEALKKELKLQRRRDWTQYSCVFIIPDLYDRNYVTQMLEMLLRDFGFSRVCFIQESLAATFGSNYGIACIVDVGAQKTSVCCVEDGLCIDDSRINLKFGGSDITDTFMRMMLHDLFPYDEINLKRRYDFLLAEELKKKHITATEDDVTVQNHEFHVRAPGQDTRKYQFKTFDEPLLCMHCLYKPTMFDHSGKLDGRRSLVGLSTDLYDGSPNDPVSAAQSEVVTMIAPAQAAPTMNGDAISTAQAYLAPSKQLQNPLSRLMESEAPSSHRGSPAPGEDGDTPAPAGEEGKPEAPVMELPPCLRDDVLPVMALDQAILLSITHAARGDDKKARDFIGGVMVIGGGSQIRGFETYLETRLKWLRPALAKEVQVGRPPRELDPQAVSWKGGSICGKLRTANEMSIGKLEFDRLGARCLAYKCLWGW